MTSVANITESIESIKNYDPSNSELFTTFPKVWPEFLVIAEQLNSLELMTGKKLERTHEVEWRLAEADGWGLSEEDGWGVKKLCWSPGCGWSIEIDGVKKGIEQRLNELEAEYQLTAAINNH